MMLRRAKPTPAHITYPQPVNCGSFSMLLFDGSIKSFFYWPIKNVNPRFNGSFFYPRFLRPFGKAKSLIIKCYDMIISSISHLFFAGRPATVLFTVVPIHVNAVNGCILFAKFLNMIKIRFIHIISEFLKGFPKTFNTSFTVVGPPIAKGASTSHQDSSPYIPESCLAQAMSFSKSMFHGIINFFQATTATCGMTTNNMRTIRNNFFSTITSKKPFIPKVVISDSSGMKFYSHKFPKSFSSNVISTTKNISFSTFIPRNMTFWNSITQIIYRQTATRLSSAISKTSTWNNLLIPAIAFTKKQTITPFVNALFFNNQESTESLTNQVNLSHI